MKTSLSEQTGDPVFGTPVYVFEAPVRIWHWVNALAITVLSITGYLIANPLPSVGGEASDHFVMGNIRMIHFIAAYVFAIGFAVRIYWAIVGNRYSREIFYIPIWNPRFAVDFFRKACFYLFIHCRVTKFVGHNPLARTTMFFFVTLVGVFMIFTGFALYSEGLGQGSWADRLFGWVIPLLGGSKSVHNLHDLGMWLMITFVIVHVYMAIRDDIISRQSSISAMISGWRLYKDERP